MSDPPIPAIHTEHAPPPNGHYSQAVVHRGIVYVATQLPIAADGSVTPAAPIERQLAQAMTNAEAILRAADSDLSLALLVTVYVADVAHWPAVNAAYAAIMGPHRPARSVVPTGVLHLGYAIGVQITAATRSSA